MVWADNNYAHKKKITIPPGLVPSNQTDFTIVINTTDIDLDSCLANGYDIKFYDSTETVQLKHEREKWIKITGELVVWVKIPSLSSIANTIIYMYYEYPGEVVDQQDENNTWDSDFIGVFHMDDLAVNAEAHDSTSNNHDFQEFGTGHVYRVAGKNGYAIDLTDRSFYDGDAFINTGASPVNMNLKSLNAMTIEAWHQPDRDGNSAQPNFIFGSRHHASEDIRFHHNLNAPNDCRLGCYWDDGVVDGCQVTNITTIIDQWYYLASAIDNAGAGFIKNYSDPIPGHTFNICTDASVNYNFGTTAGPPFYHSIGCRQTTSRYHFYDGALDEIRLSKIARTENWLQTCYNNQSDPSSFMTFGAEESSGVVLNLNPIKTKTERYKFVLGHEKDIQKYKYRAIKDKEDVPFKIEKEEY